MKQDVQHNIQQKANLIWNIADCIDGVYKPHEYGKVKKLTIYSIISIGF